MTYQPLEAEYYDTRKQNQIKPNSKKKRKRGGKLKE